MQKKTAFLGAAMAVALLGSTTSVYAKPVSPVSAWKRVALNTQQAAFTQMTLNESVTVTDGRNKDTFNIHLAAVQQRNKKGLQALLNVTEEDTATGQKQSAKLYQMNDNVYRNVGSGTWQLVERTKAPLVGQYVNQLYTNIKMKSLGHTHEFTMGTDPKVLASLVQGIVGQKSSQANIAKVFKNAKSNIVVDTILAGGNEKIKKLIANIDVPTTVDAFGGSSSSQTVTNSVYGTGSGSSQKVDIRVHETVMITYKKRVVTPPHGFGK